MQKILFIKRLCWMALPLLFGFSKSNAQSFAWPNASTYNKNTDKYYITNYKGQNVISLDKYGNKAVVVSGLTAPNNLLYASLPLGEGYIVLDSNQIKGYDSGWNYYASFSTSGAKKMQDAVFDDVNNILYITDVDRGVIYKTIFGGAPFFLPSTSIFSSPFRRPSAMVLQPSKNRILYVEDTIGGNLMALNLSNGNTSLVKNLNMDNIIGLAEDAQGNLYLSSLGLKGIYQLNKYYAGSPVKLYSEPKPGDLLVNDAKDQWVYMCLICGTVFTPPLHLFGPGLEIMGCPKDSINCYKNYLHRNIGTFDSGNQFIMEMSNKSGQFTSPKRLATITDTLIPAEMKGLIPTGFASGTGFKIRWRSTKPAISSLPETMEIYPTPSAVVSISDTVQACNGNTIKLGEGNSTDTQFKYSWSPKGEIDSATNPSVVCTANKTKWIFLTVKNPQGCTSKDSAFIKPVSKPDAGNLRDTIKVCEGSTATLGTDSLSGLSYSWSPGYLLNDSTAASPRVKPSNPTKFYLTVTAAGGCFSLDSQYVRIISNPTFKLAADSVSICESKSGLNSIIPDNNPYKCIWINEKKDTTKGDNLNFFSGNSIKAQIWRVVYTNTNSNCFSERVFKVKTFEPVKPALVQLPSTDLTTVPLMQNTKWYRNDTLIATNTDTILLLRSGRYHACGTTNYFCTECTSNFGFTLNKIASFQPNLNCTFYPNPTKDKLNIKCVNGELLNWDIFSIDGRLVLHGKGKIVDLEKLNLGIYYLKLNTNISKIIIKI